MTVPVARGCPRCGGWFTRRALHSEEPPRPAYTCAFCGEDIQIEGGIPVSVGYVPTATDERDRNHAPRTGPHATPATIARELAGQQ